MENEQPIINILLKQTENYIRSSAELYKLQIIKKSAAIVSTLVTRLLIIIIGAMVLIITSIGVALWIGSVMGEAYLGFFIVGAFYAIAGLIVFLCRNSRVKTPVANFIITNALN